MSEVIGLGQRELIQDGEFIPTPEEQALLDTNGVSAERLQQFVDAHGTQTINAALGGYATMLAQSPIPEVPGEIEVAELGETPSADSAT